MPTMTTINPALIHGNRERMAAAAQARRHDALINTPAHRRAVAPSTATLTAFGAGCGVAGAAVASSVALPWWPMRLLALSAPPAMLARRGLAQGGFDAPRLPAANAERWAATAGHFLLAGAAVAGAAQLVLRIYPPHAWRGALVGLGAALVPVALGERNSPLCHEGCARWMEAWGPAAGRLARALTWPTRLGALAVALLSPGSAVAAGTICGAGIVAVGAGLVAAVGVARPAGHSPAQEALELQPKLGMAALLGMFVGHSFR